ncbi:MAG TPA: Lrp/AsnC family transcriptional regulator [Candidatus Nitrosocosmicus sp.]|nr:Lrp/AsnC family transcriptional regulator [Candidatus Nitrosocosmicus sp.]
MKSTLTSGIDKIDTQILDLLVQNHNNKQISKTLKIPLSTVQRRVRKLIEKGFVTSKTLINFTKFGFKSGSIHIYLDDGNVDAILKSVSKLKGVTALEVHIGNSDIIAGVVYKDGRDLLYLIANIKKMEGVERIVWSERIFEYPLTSNNISLLELEPIKDL